MPDQSAADQNGSKTPRKSRAVEVEQRYWLFVIPAAIAVLVLIVVPLVFAVGLSLRHFNLLLGTDAPAGLANYVRALTKDPEFYAALLRTFLYVAIVVSLDFVLGFVQALLLYGLSPRLTSFFRGLFLLPILMIPAAGATFWRLVMYGSPNVEIYRAIGIFGAAPPPLGDPNLAFFAIILTVWWAWSPWVFLLLLGGLEGLDRSVIEAAQMDGASYRQIVRRIILPLMKPVIFVTLAFKAVDSFLTFDFVWILTEGGPGHSSQVGTTYIYRYAFGALDYGYGAAMSMIMLVVSAALSIAAVLYWQRNQQGEEA
jgi:ABC-type sugar transport system permease subunit